MNYVSYGFLLIWLQSTLALQQVQVPAELEFLAKNLSPMECARLCKSLRRRTLGIGKNQSPQRDQAQRLRESPDCKKMLVSILRNSEKPINEFVELSLKEIGRNDLAHWLGYNVVRERQLRKLESQKPSCHRMQNLGARNMAGYDHLVHGASKSVKLTADETVQPNTNPPQTVLQKVIITIVVILSMTTLCLCCYKFLYARMPGGHFTNFRYNFVEANPFDDRVKKEFDEESWLQQDRRLISGGGPRSCCSALSNSKKSWRNSIENLKREPVSVVEYLKNKIKNYADGSRDKRCREFRLLVNRLQKTCPTQRKIIHLSRREQCLLKSLSEAERHQLPATESDYKFLIASNREKRKLLTREARREFLIELRKRLEKIDPELNRNITLNETERKFIRKLSSSERLLLPIMDKDLELLVSSPLEKRRVMLRQLACRLAGISREDRKYLELETGDKKFLKDLDESEKKKLGITESEFRFLVASNSQRTVMQQRLESCDREWRINEIRKRLIEVNYDVSYLELSRIEHSTFLSLNSCELARLGLTDEHVKFYAASESERKIIWPSPSQHRNLKLKTLRSRLSKLPWKDCSARLTHSEHKLLASLTPREQDNLNISDSEKNFMLSTDSKRDLIQRQRKIEKLEDKIRDFNTVTMTESERGLILSLSPSEMEMLNIDSTNKSSLLERKSNNSVTRNKIPKIGIIKERINRDGISNVRLTNSERCLIESLSAFETDSCELTPSQLSFLLKKGSEHKFSDQGSNYGHQMAVQSAESGTKRCASTRDMQVNTSPRYCNREMNTASNHHQNVHFSHDTESNYQESRHKVQFKEPEVGDGATSLRETNNDSEFSETYDELGMLFSQQMKEQARPCQRKYCLLGRHLKKARNFHDAKQCQFRHHCCRGYPSDQRPSCSSGNVCKDTYDEFHLMHARPNEMKQLNSSMFERRKQFLDQPCRKCPAGHDYQVCDSAAELQSASVTIEVPKPRQSEARASRKLVV